MGVLNPFEKRKVELNLSIADLEMIIKIMINANPQGDNEEWQLIQLYEQFCDKLKEVKNA